MNTKTELTAADLALYLGCEVEWTGERGYFLAGINTGQENFNPVGLVSEQMEPVWVKFDEIKPILRPLSDMTERELLQFAKICTGADSFEIKQAVAINYKLVRCIFGQGRTVEVELLMVSESGETWYTSYFDSDERGGRNVIRQHQQTVWLLSKHFDLFGWIDAGRAIDKAKTETP